jgi:predicted RNA polymerase sigma factor
MASTGETLENVFREEHGRIIAGLIHLSGSFDLAEEALQVRLLRRSFTGTATVHRAGPPPG